MRIRKAGPEPVLNPPLIICHSPHNNLKMDSKKTQDMAIAEQRLRYTALFGKPPTKRLENNPRWLATQIDNHAVIHEIAGLRKE